MHLLTITPFYPRSVHDPRGCFVFELFAPLQDLGVENSVLAVAPIHQRTRVAKGAPPSATLVRYPAIAGNLGLSSAGLLLFACLIRRVRRLHRTRPIDLIHAHAALPSGHAASLLGRELGIPFVVTVHGLDAFFDQQVSRHSGRWCRRMATHVYRSARKVICISERVRERLLEGCPDCVSSVVYNGVNPRLFSPAVDSDERRPTVLSVGNLISIKGHELLLRAIAEVRPRHPEILCRIIGSGPEQDRLTVLSQELGISDCVQFLGSHSRTEVADAMRRCTLFALPSRYEGLGCVYLEAMASGKAVIGCRGQGIAEVIRHGRNGLLVGSDNVRELAEAMSLLIRDANLRVQLGRAARDTITAGYTLSDQAEQLYGIYLEGAR